MSSAKKVVQQLLQLRAELLSTAGLLLISLGVALLSLPLGVISLGGTLLLIAKACENDQEPDN